MGEYWLVQQYASPNRAWYSRSLSVKAAAVIGGDHLHNTELSACESYTEGAFPWTGELFSR